MASDALETPPQTPEDVHSAYWALAQARPDYERAEKFYCGTVEEQYSSAEVARLLRRFGLNNMDTFNFAHIAVDVIADNLHVSSVSAEDNTLDLLLDELRDANELDEELPALLRSACKYGDAYLMVWPDTDQVGNVSGVKMRAKDPLTTRVFYDDEDPMVKALAIQSWDEGTKKAPVIRANVYYADRIERWVHKGKVQQDPKKAKWVEYTEDGQPARLANPFGEVPFFHFRTGRTYGTPEHYNAYGPQVAINKLVTSHMATVDYQSFPQRYALVDPAADFSGAQGSDFNEEHPQDGMDPETMGQSQLDATPAALWNLSGYKEVGQFDAAQPDTFLKPLDRYIKAMAQVTGIPMHAFDSTGDAISGASRRIANEPLYVRVESLQKSFGATAKGAYEFALSILGEDDTAVSVHWKPVRQIDDKEGWEILALKKSMGVPDDVLLAEAGYEKSDIDKWLADKAETQAPITGDPFQAPIPLQPPSGSKTPQVDNSTAAPSGQPPKKAA